MTDMFNSAFAGLSASIRAAAMAGDAIAQRFKAVAGDVIDIEVDRRALSRQPKQRRGKVKAARKARLRNQRR